MSQTGLFQVVEVSFCQSVPTEQDAADFIKLDGLLSIVPLLCKTLLCYFIFSLRLVYCFLLIACSTFQKVWIYLYTQILNVAPCDV